MAHVDDRFLVNPFNDENFEKMMQSVSHLTSETNFIASFLQTTREGIKAVYGDKFERGADVLKDATLPVDAKRKYFLDVLAYHTSSFPPDALYKAVIAKVIHVAVSISPELRTAINTSSGVLSRLTGEYDTVEEWLDSSDFTPIPAWVVAMLDYVADEPTMHFLLETFIQTLIGFDSRSSDDIDSTSLSMFDSEMDMDGMKDFMSGMGFETLDLNDAEEIDPTDLNLNQDEDLTDDDE